VRREYEPASDEVILFDQFSNTIEIASLKKTGLGKVQVDETGV
jgi:hypothetical protein